MSKNSEAGLFCALLKYWRNLRGLSQLDLALHAEVSARHVSFLETGRSKPSEDMILRLADTLSVPLRDQNALLKAAGFPAAWDEPSPEDGFSGPVGRALERMLAKQEPYPMLILDRRFDVLRANTAAERVFSRFVADPLALAQPFNAYRLVFDPAGARPFVVDWERVARSLLAHLQRTALTTPRDATLRELLDELLAFPDVPASWRGPDFSLPVGSTFSFRLERGELSVGFLTTLTLFSVPQNVTLEELRIESYFPLDEESERLCLSLAEEG